MKKSEVQIGATYVAKVSGKLAHVRIVSESQYGGWNAVNTLTKREVRIKSAARLRRKVDTDRLAAIKGLREGGMTFDAARAQVDANERRMREISEEIREKEEAR
jgi:hypothetical protein